MLPPPTIHEIYSCEITEDGQDVFLYVILSDGSMALAIYGLDEVLIKSKVVEHAEPARPLH